MGGGVIKIVKRRRERSNIFCLFPPLICECPFKWIQLQVHMLQDKLEEKDEEIQRLKQELQKKSLTEEDDRKYATPKENNGDEVMSGEVIVD